MNKEINEDINEISAVISVISSKIFDLKHGKRGGYVNALFQFCSFLLMKRVTCRNTD